MKWISMMKYTPQGAASIQELGATGRRDAIVEALGANGVTVLHWWHGCTPEWDVLMIVDDGDQSSALQAKFIIDTFASGDMARASTIPLVEAEEIDAVQIVAHPSNQ